MKKIVVLLFSLVLFNNCGGADDGDNSFDTDVSDDADNPVCGDGVCEPEEIGHCMVDCDEDTDSPDGEEADASYCPIGCACCADYEDCACWKWPQVVEYLFIEGTWRLAECDGGMCAEEKIRDLVIESWDDELGANILELAPFSNGIYLKKNSDNGQFEFGNPDEPTGSGLTNGTADPVSLEIFIAFYNLDGPAESHTFKWKKVE